MINFPTFLTIENKDYKEIKNKTKKVDKNLVNLIKMSKYDGEKTFSENILKTEPCIKEEKMNMTVSFDKHNYSLTRNDDTTMNPYENISFDFRERSKME